MGLPNGPEVDFGRGSSTITILSGSNITGSTKQFAFGEYKHWMTSPFDSSVTGSKDGFSGSFVPRGELFNIVVSNTGCVDQNASITDIKITPTEPNENYNPLIPMALWYSWACFHS